MCLRARAWAAAVAAGPEPPVSRRYVDDLTCWTAGNSLGAVATVAAAWETTREFAEGLQLEARPAKTVQFGASGELRRV